jgi:ubiquitin-conjugating enzyme E2 S
VNTLKRDWKTSNTVAHVLAVVRCLLIVPFPESSLNDDAGKLFMESYDDYAKKARMMTRIHAVAEMPATGASVPVGSGSGVTSIESASSGAGEGGGGACGGVHAEGALKEHFVVVKASKGKKKAAGKKRAAGAGAKSKKKKGLKRL